MNPYIFPLYAWREMTTLHVTFEKVAEENSKDDKAVLNGELSISMTELLKSILSLQGNNRGRFMCLLSGSLLRTYFLPIPRGSQGDLILSEYKSYPSSTLHEIKAGNNFLIPGSETCENSIYYYTQWYTYSPNFFTNQIICP